MKYIILFMLLICGFCEAFTFNEFYVAVSKDDSSFTEITKANYSDAIFEDGRILGLWINVNPYIVEEIIENDSFVTRYKQDVLQILVYRREYDINKKDIWGFGEEKIDTEGNKVICFPLRQESFAKLEKMTQENMSRYMIRVYDNEVYTIKKITSVNRTGELIWPIKYLTSELKGTHGYDPDKKHYDYKAIAEEYFTTFLPHIVIITVLIFVIKNKKILYLTGSICGAWVGFTLRNIDPYTLGEFGMTVNIVLLDLILGVLAGLLIMKGVVKWKERRKY